MVESFVLEEGRTGEVRGRDGIVEEVVAGRGGGRELCMLSCGFGTTAALRQCAPGSQKSLGSCRRVLSVYERRTVW